MKIAVLGVNHKLADVHMRELLAKSCNRHFAPTSATFNLCAFVLLSTCNRTEIYFSAPNLAEMHSTILNCLRRDIEDDFDQKLYSYFGRDCFLHLCRVTAGLDSALLGETEIQGQVKQAYEQAKACSVLPKALHYLFQKALNAGKKIRSTITFENDQQTIEDAIMQAGRLSLKNPKNCKILFVGASSINKRVLNYFNLHSIGKDIAICNRSKEHANELACKYQLKYMPWEELKRWPEYDWIICGTKSQAHVIAKNSYSQEIASQKLLIDLGIPRNIDPSLSQNQHISLWNIDQLNSNSKTRLAQASPFFQQADALASNFTQRYMCIYREREERQTNYC